MDEVLIPAIKQLSVAEETENGHPEFTLVTALITACQGVKEHRKQHPAPPGGFRLSPRASQADKGGWGTVNKGRV